MDLSRPERIYQVTHGDLRTEFPGLNTLRTEETKLPIQLSSFVGRDQESAEVGKLLRGSRLVTLTGAGGSGKSRLAMEVASRAQSDFPNGVWIVEFASLADPALVGQSVAAVLGVSEKPDIARVRDRRSPRQAHTPSGVRQLRAHDRPDHRADLAGPCRSTGGAGVLATSRQPLHARGMTDDVPADLLREDSLDHAFLAAAHLGVAHEDPKIAALALAAESTYRSSHQVLPDVLRDANTGRLVGQVRDLLAFSDFESAWERGSEMTLEDILELTLTRFDRAGSPSALGDSESDS